jgi:molecular chaperone DnaK
MSGRDTIRVRLRYPDHDTFLKRFSPNVTRGGIFLATREVRSVGSVVRFEVSLRHGNALLAGEGRVAWVRDFNPAEPHRPYGMGVQFLDVDPETQPVLDALLRNKETSPRITGSRPVISAQSTAAGPRDNGRDTQPQLEAVHEAEDYDVAIDEPGLRRAVERARALAARTEDPSALITAETEEPVSLVQALSELPRFLKPRP